MQKNLVLERSQKQYLIKSASGKDGNAGIDIAFIRTVHRNLLRLYRLYTFVFARGKRALEGAAGAVAVVPIQSGTKRQSEQYALFFAMPAALYARSAAESGDKKAYDAYKLTPFSVCAVEDLQKLSQQLANVRCRTQKDFAATMRVLCRAVVTLETPYQMTIDVRQEADLNSVLDNTGDYFLPEETPSPAFSLENNALPAPAGFQSTPKISHPATIGGFAHPAAPARDLMGTIPAPAAPRTGGFAATVPFEGERVTPPQKKAEPPKKAAADAPTFVTDDVQPEAPEFDLTNVFSPMASSKSNEAEPPARTPDRKRANAPEKKSAPRQTRVSPFWIGHEAELAPKGRVIEAPGADYTLEESEPTPSAQKAPASFHPMASSTQKEPASFHPMASSTQKEPASFHPMANSAQKEPASFRPTAKPAETEPEGAKKPDAVTLPKDELRAKPRAKDAQPAESRDTLVLPVNVVDAFEDKKEKRPAEASKKSEEEARPSVMAYRFDYFADHTPERQIKSPFRMNTTQKEDTQAVRRIVREDAPAQPEKEKPEEVAPEVREEAVFAAPEIAPDVVSDEKADAIAETTPEIAPNDVQTLESDAPFFVTDIVTDPQPEAEGAQEEKAQAKTEDAPFLVTDIETFAPDARDDAKEEAAQDAVSEQTAEAPADEIAEAPQDSAAKPAIETVGAEEAADAGILEEKTVEAAETAETEDAGTVEEETVEASETTEAEDVGTVEEKTAEAAETADAENVGTVEEKTVEASETTEAEDVGTVEEKTVEAAETAEAEDVDHTEEKADDAPIAVPLYYTRDDRDAALDEELDEIFGELMRDTRHDTPEGELDEFLEELETSQDDSASRAPIPADRLADVLSREDEESGKSAEPTAETSEEPTEASPAPVEPIDIDVDEPQTWQEAVADEAIRHAEQLREGEKPRRTMFVPRIVQTPPAEEEAEEIKATDAPDLLPEDAAAPEPAAEDVLPGELPGEETESGDLHSSAAEDPARDEDNHENNDNNNIVETADEAPENDAFAAPRASAPYAYDVEVLVADEVPPQEASRIVGDYERSRGQNVGDLWEQVQKHWDIAEPLRIANENEVRISPEKEAFIREQADAIADELAADEPIDTQHMRDAVNSDEAFAARSRALYDKIRIATPVIPPQDARQSAAPAQEALETSFDDMAETDFDAASDVFGETFDDDFEDTTDEAFGDDFDDEIDEPAEEPAFEEDAPVVPAALDALYTPPAALDAPIGEDAPETDEAEDDDDAVEADGEEISEKSDARDAVEAGENAEVSEKAILEESAGDIAVEETVERTETADEPALEEEIEEETAESAEANAEEIEAAATDDAQTAVEETEAEPLDAAETETDEADADGDAEEDEPAALPPQDPFLAAGVPASGPMAALAASIRATQRQLEQEIARIRKRFAAISPEADEDETRAIFGRASIDEALPQSAENAEEEEAREIVLDAIDDEMNDTAVLDDLFEDAPARDGADVSSEEETAEEAAEDEATDADDAFGELFADDAGDEFVADAEDPSVKEDSNDSDDGEFPSIDDAAFEAVFGQKKTDAEEVPDEAADDVFETESEDALDEEPAETDAAETGFVLVNHTEIAEDAFAQGSDGAVDEEPAETDETETGFVLVNHAKTAEDAFAQGSDGTLDEAPDETDETETGFVLVNHTEIAEDAFAQGSDGALDEEPAETDEIETGFVLVNHADIAEDAFVQGFDGAVDEEADVPEANEAEFGWNDAVETDEDIFGQDADRAFGLGDAAPKDTEADVVTENDAFAEDAGAPVVAGAVFVPDAEDDADTLADEDAAQTYGYEQVRTIEPIESPEDDSAPTLEDELAEAADDYAAQEAQIDALLYGDLPAVPDDVFADETKDAEPSAEEAFETADLYAEGGAFAEEAFEEGTDDTEAFDAFGEDEPQPDWADGEDENGEDPWDDRTDEEDFADGEPFERNADFYDGLSDETDAVYGDGFVMLSQDEPSQTEEAPEEPQDDEADAAPAYDEAIYDEESYSDAYIAELDDVLSETAETQEPEESVPQAEASDEDDFDDADASDDPLAEEQARLEREIAEQERLIAESRRNRRMLDELAAQLDRTIAQNTAAAAEAAREQVAREKFERTMRIPAQRAPQQTPPAAFDEPAAQMPPQDYRYGAEDAPAAPQQAHRTQKKAARHRTKRWWR